MDSESETRISKTKRRITAGFRSSLNDFWKIQEYNRKTFRQQPLQEISGAFGDIGTFLPIIIAYVANRSKPAIDLCSTLVFTGLFNIFTGLFFGVPLPVQPMKAIAAVALSRAFNKEEVAVSGLIVGIVVGVLSVSRLLEWFNRKIPVPVIKGIQVGVGLSLITNGGSMFVKDDDFFLSQHLPQLLQVIAFVGFLASNVFRRLPLALILLSLGILVALPSLINHPQALGIWRPHPFMPITNPSFQSGLDAALGQIPLTVLNSIIAVSALSADLLPNMPTPSPTAIGLSVAAMNLVGCWFGSMPVCHGSGGLAAQYRFGARSGASVIFLGLIKLLLGLFAGCLAQEVFQGIPNAFLGIMLIAAGLELANVGEALNTAEARDISGDKDGLFVNLPSHGWSNALAGEDLTLERRKRRWTIMLITAGGIIALKSDTAGFVAGMLCHWSYQWYDRYDSRRSIREGTIRLGDENSHRPQAVVS
ncbi:MAG: hypothetical protein Q9188_003883 [Gyalolechia gomerana]